MGEREQRLATSQIPWRIDPETGARIVDANDYIEVMGERDALVGIDLNLKPPMTIEQEKQERLRASRSGHHRQRRTSE